MCPKSTLSLLGVAVVMVALMSLATFAETPDVVLNNIRKKSVCAPPGTKETMLGLILSSQRNKPQALIVSKAAREGADGITEDAVMSWYSDTLNEVVTMSLPKQGETYLTTMTSASSVPNQFILPRAFNRPRKVTSVNLGEEVPRTDVPHFVLNLCANLAPGKYDLLLLDTDIIVGEPRKGFENLPKFSLVSSGGILQKLTFMFEDRTWQVSFTAYARHGDINRPNKVEVTGPSGKTTIEASQWMFVVAQEIDYGFSDQDLGQPFGIAAQAPNPN